MVYLKSEKSDFFSPCALGALLELAENLTDFAHKLFKLKLICVCVKLK